MHQAVRLPVTERLAAFVAEQSWDRMSPEAREEAKRAIADCIGGALAALNEPVTRITLDLVRSESGPSAIWGAGIATSARNAALVNGTMAHAHDFDDTNSSMRGHPSAPVVPAIFALAPEAKASGKDLIAAYLVGVEVETKLGRAMNMEHYERGWHTTPTLGSIGAAAAGAKLLRLDATAARNALAIAASLTGGLRANFGTMTKPLHAGVAAENGVLAARLAQGGLTASANAIEGTDGFFQLFCGLDNVAANKALANLGAPYDAVSPGIIYKIYPSCSLTHCAIDIILDAVKSGEIVPSEVDQINCGVGYRCETTLPYHRAENGLEGKFCLEYCVAAALTYGKVGIAEFEDAAVNAPAIKALYDRIKVYIHTALRGRDSVDRDFTEIEVLHRSGRRFQTRLSMPKGHPNNPLTWDDLEEKYRLCVKNVLDAGQAKEIWRKLKELDRLSASDVAFAL